MFLVNKAFFYLALRLRASQHTFRWVLDEENSRPILKKALGLGINFFDTANMYSIGVSAEIQFAHLAAALHYRPWIMM